MQVAVSGASGLLGSALSALLEAHGHTVQRLVRRSAEAPEEIAWDPAFPPEGEIDVARLASCDAVVHLAGEPVGGRWSDDRKRRILDSRVQGTQLIAQTMAGLRQGPKVLVCASAIGYYGDRGDEVLTEAAAPGEGFLAEVCQQWEAAAAPARQAGIRVTHVRMGIVQSPRGGALARLLPLYRLGLGGPLGSGRQWQSWISIDDAVGVLYLALTDERVEGAVNATAPQPVHQREYARTLGRVLARPALLPTPAAAPALVLGREGAQQMAMASQRVLPQQAQRAGYVFTHPSLEVALRALLGRDGDTRADGQVSLG